MPTSAVSLQIPHSAPWITQGDQDSVNAVLKSGMLASGEKTQAFTQQFSDYLGVPYAFSVSSGTAALMMALLALDIQPEDEVILPTMVCGSVEQAIVTVGATPVFCDVGPHWVMTAETVQAVLTSKTKAIVAVHLYGIGCDIPALKPLGVPVIEDCCQALGPLPNGTMPGQAGDLAVFSFHATKCLTTGEGGMVTTFDSHLAHHLADIQSADPCLAPLTDLESALGQSQLTRYPEFLARRIQLADNYFNQLPADWVTETHTLRSNSMFYRFPIQIPVPFEATQAYFADHGIAVRHGVDTLLHAAHDMSDAHFSNSRALFNQTVSLPLYPSLTEVQQRHIIQVAKAYKQSLG